MTYFIIKLHLIGISQANLEKKPRWVKIWNERFPIQDMLGLCYTLSLSLYIYIYID